MIVSWSTITHQALEGPFLKTAETTSELRASATLPLHDERADGRASNRSDTGASQLSASLQARNRELAAYAHTVAHNLKDPLSVIIGTSDAILHISDLTPEELRAYLEQIQATARTMDDIIDNLLLLAEIEEALVPVQRLDMDGIVSNVQLRLGYLIKAYQARIIAPKAWPAAMGYGPWIEEVWTNLISNGIKYGGQPPRVHLGAVVRPDGMVLYWVQDNGKGLSREAQAHLFTPFTQLGPVRTPGHGLGLSIVRRIVEKLGGQVGVETEAGRGSQFFFTLPARM